MNLWGTGVCFVCALKLFIGSPSAGTFMDEAHIEPVERGGFALLAAVEVDIESFI